MKTSFTILLTTLIPQLVVATFTLQDQGPDWDYTTKDLAPSTSQKCKDAYIAPIDCNPTLLGLVASMRPLFKPTSQDLADTCTSECAASLEKYVQNVRAACTTDGDHAQESLGAAGNVDSIRSNGYKLDPVETVGRVFQYVMARSCGRNSQGEWCYQKTLQYPPNLSCDDECSIGFYKSAHDSPFSSLQFNYYFLINRGSWWANEFGQGWQRVVECGKDAGVNEWLGSSGMTSTTASMSSSATQTQTEKASSTETGSASTGSASTTNSTAGSSTSSTVASESSLTTLSNSSTATSSNSASSMPVMLGIARILVCVAVISIFI